MAAEVPLIEVEVLRKQNKELKQLLSDALQNKLLISFNKPYNGLSWSEKVQELLK